MPLYAQLRWQSKPIAARSATAVCEAESRSCGSRRCLPRAVAASELAQSIVAIDQTLDAAAPIARRARGERSAKSRIDVVDPWQA